MTRYLLGNLESRHILPDNDPRLERAKINVSRRLSFFFFWGGGLLCTSWKDVSYSIEDEQYKCNYWIPPLHCLQMEEIEGFPGEQTDACFIPDCGLVMALSYTGMPSPTLLKAFSVIT